MKRIIGTKENIDIVEIGDCTVRLELLCDNLFLIRVGLRNEESSPLPEVTDNALSVVENEIRRLTEKIDDLLYVRKEVE